MRITRKLADLQYDDVAYIGGIERVDAHTLRLMEMGLFPGAQVSGARAPYSDPLEVRAGDTELCLRRYEAEAFTLTDQPPAVAQDALPALPARSERKTPPQEILLVGAPNAGKTTLFNRLTGARAKVGNYPGITVEDRRAPVSLSQASLTLIDLPGLYSLAARSKDEEVTLRAVLAKNHMVACVVDATQLERSLVLVTQLLELGQPFCICVTMLDRVDKGSFDLDKLRENTGVAVADARDISALKQAFEDTAALNAHAPQRTPGLEKLTKESQNALVERGEAIAQNHKFSTLPFTLGFWDEHLRFMYEVSPLSQSADEPTRLTPKDFSAVVIARHQHAALLARDVKSDGDSKDKAKALGERIDNVVLHPILGALILAGVFFALFQMLFVGAAPLMDALEALTGMGAGLVDALVPKERLPLVHSLLKDGVIAGVGNVVVFVPQIAILFFFIGFLEDCGYLARAAFLLDRALRPFGLAGRAFVPLLSGFACAVPAVMAARTIDGEKDRLLTILVTPLVSCSARLPIYTLIIATVFATTNPLFGVLNVGALLFTAMYALSIFAALLSAIFFRKVLGVRTKVPSLLLELPPYRWPDAKTLFRNVLGRVRIFLAQAGTIILALTVVLWALFTFPRQGDDVAKSVQVEQSIAGTLGHALEPVIAPLGFDWKIGVGLVASFAAREVLVSSLGVIYGLGDDADENSVGLRQQMAAEKKADGSPRYSPLTGLALMIFFVLAMQCMSTVAAVRRETQSWKWPLIQVAYMNGLAYLGALLVYQVGRLLGFS